MKQNETEYDETINEKLHTRFTMKPNDNLIRCLNDISSELNKLNQTITLIYQYLEFNNGGSEK
jgi:hypothetical protein